MNEEVVADRTMLQKIKDWYAEFKPDLKKMYWNFKKALTSAGIITALVSFFTGHIFSAIAIGGLTYIFWKNSRGIDELVGVCPSCGRL